MWSRFRGQAATLDLTANQLSGTLPTWIFTALRSLTDDDLRVMRLALVPQQGGRLLSCPPPAARAPGSTYRADPLIIRLEFLYNLKCRHSVLGDVYLSDVSDPCVCFHAIILLPQMLLRDMMVSVCMAQELQQWFQLPFCIQLPCICHCSQNTHITWCDWCVSAGSCIHGPQCHPCGQPS